MPKVPTLMAAALLSGAAVTQVAAQNVTEWSSEARTTLSFKVNPALIQPLLPAGWTPNPSTSPATPGATVTVTFMERQVVLDPQGKPIRNGTSRYAVVTVPAVNHQTNQSNTMVVAGLSPEGAGAYGVYTPATKAALRRTVEGDREDFARVDEVWDLEGSNGDHLMLQVTYRRGPVTRARVETVIRSAARPEFQRTYHIEQAADVLRSANTPDRVEHVAFRATGPSVGRLFDGTETLLGVTAIPYYVREISIP